MINTQIKVSHQFCQQNLLTQDLSITLWKSVPKGIIQKSPLWEEGKAELHAVWRKRAPSLPKGVLSPFIDSKPNLML
jgi:hypothetical protein